MKHRWTRISMAIISATFLLSGTAGAANTNGTQSDVACPDSTPIIKNLWRGATDAAGEPRTCLPPASAINNSVNNGNGTTQGNTTQPPSTTAPQQTTGSYVALGDSVAAGLGLPLAAGYDPACGVSADAYPFIVARRIGQSVTNAACSGATAGDLFTNQHLSNTGRNIGPQLNRAFANGTPSLITITAGANDLHWSQYLRKCYVATCGTAFDDITANVLLQTAQSRLNWDLSEINRMSGGMPPTVVLTGYYHPIANRCNLAGNAIAPREANWLNSEIDRLNQSIRSTASRYGFARFASVSFAGHELCTTHLWVQGLQDPAPIHPTARGQRAIANSVLSQL